MKKILTILTILIATTLFAQTTYVPDDNFEQALIDLGYDVGTLDDYVPTANIASITVLSINSKNISDLTGIEDFTSIEQLYAFNNNITNLDISQNVALTTLNISNNNALTTLDISNNTALTILSCYGDNLSSLNTSSNPLLTTINCSFNSISSLNLSNNLQLESLDCNVNSIANIDVSQNVNLTNLICSSNGNLSSIDISQNTLLNHLGIRNDNFTALDVSNNLALTSIDAHNNQITSLDISLNTNVAFLNISNNQLTDLNVRNGNNVNFTNFYADNNVGLTCINVDDVAWSTANWTNIDPQTSFGDGCVPNATYIPDDNFEQALINLGYDSGTLDNYVPTANIEVITNLDISNYYIVDLTGIKYFTALQVLNCQNNQIEILDLSFNTALTEVNCSNNLIQTLDFSQSTSLINLNCANNQLTFLDVKNGNNTNFTGFDATNNANLTCINVDNASWSTTNWTNIDATASFSIDCTANLTYVPDDNFEQALIDLGYDSGVLDDFVDTATIAVITTLNVQSLNITDLTGIEDFTALQELFCSNNQINGIDVSNNTNLTILHCNNNPLGSLDITTNTQLISLYCISTQLTALNISQNTNLENLNCGYNDIGTLNLSQNTNLLSLNCASNLLQALNIGQNPLLTTLNCSINQLTALNISQNTALTEISCQSNQITTLDVSTHTALYNLNCSSNDLQDLNVKNGNNSNFTFFSALNNSNLTCIEVDDTAWSTTNWTNIDAQTNFSENCSLVNYNLSITIVGNGSVSPNGGSFTQNDTFDITATPDAGWEFAGWSGDATGMTNPLSITMDADKNITATFTQIQQTLTVNSVGNGSVSPSSGTYNQGQTVNITATPDAGWEFTGWSGDATGTANPLSTTMDADKNITATFTETASISDYEKFDIDIYPNPVKDSFTIINKSNFTIEQIRIYNLLGKLVYNTTENSTSISTSSIVNGVYFIKLKSNNKSITKKIIISN